MIDKNGKFFKLGDFVRIGKNIVEVKWLHEKTFEYEIDGIKKREYPSRVEKVNSIPDNRIDMIISAFKCIIDGDETTAVLFF